MKTLVLSLRSGVKLTSKNKYISTFTYLTKYCSYQESTRRTNQVGMRIHWNAVKVPGTLDYWNPWSKDIPHLTLTAHTSVQYNAASPECVDFSALQKSLIAAASSDISRSLVTDEEPIVINMILGITALVHNQSKLGFCRDRGGVSY